MSDTMKVDQLRSSVQRATEAVDRQQLSPTQATALAQRVQEALAAAKSGGGSIPAPLAGDVNNLLTKLGAVSSSKEAAPSGKPLGGR